MSNDSKYTICSITSGLGNQLFQYAAGLHWQLKHNGNLLLDTSWFWFQRHRPKRSYRLGHFQIPERRPTIYNQSILLALRAAYKLSYTDSIKLFIEKCGIISVLEQDPHVPDSRFECSDLISKTSWLQGYWQTIDHFLAVRQLLVDRLRPNFQVSDDYKKLLKIIQDSDSAFVHVRRGDYASWGHSMLTPKYYSEALSLFPSNKIWFVFSEDTGWCKENLTFPGKVHYVSCKSDNSDIEELLLMAACQGGIIANSSFSWWGAALGERQGRLIVGSKFRHGEGKGDLQKYRLLPSWTTITSF